MEIRTILLPTDFSECGNYALSHAAAMARKFGASIICLNVIEPIVPTVGYSGMTEPLPIADIAEQLEDSAERELPKIAECEEFAGLNVEELVVHGEAASEIVRVAREREVDLIVIASHGRTGLGRIIFGSTAESVVRHASCPVLVVKPPQEEEANSSQ
jgi:nucleotide-binding universal stress UspA family protein